MPREINSSEILQILNDYNIIELGDSDLCNEDDDPDYIMSSGSDEEENIEGIV